MNSMTYISAALGVRCNFCHVQGDFASDNKPEKNTARGMIAMTHDINAKNFGTPTVTCYTCHRGATDPVAVPPVAEAPWPGLDLREPHHFKRDSGSIPLEAVLDRYVQALGGQAAIAKIKSRVTKMSEAQSWGATATTEFLNAGRYLYW